MFRSNSSSTTPFACLTKLTWTGRVRRDNKWDRVKQFLKGNLRTIALKKMLKFKHCAFLDRFRENKYQFYRFCFLFFLRYRYFLIIANWFSSSGICHILSWTILGESVDQVSPVKFGSILSKREPQMKQLATFAISKFLVTPRSKFKIFQGYFVWNSLKRLASKKTNVNIEVRLRASVPC